ncbi:S24/S26 family peptidase [Sphingobacterium spiritivorum]|uniref:S24/S26 family peptidase n=1 Tax=Sphingobacterium spiritivorum TaxID=258 RepID=UPI00191A4FC1|nr:S24/S26 family peptidase [Sphingobacterium spiritivorum]QQT25880.1 S24/S26 family peptidase [Sphingobacterium spiritivorum]
MLVSDEKKYRIANELFFEQVRQILGESQTVRITVAGNSMLPFLQPEDQVVLKKAEKTDLKTGKIVLALWNKSYILHRIVWKEKSAKKIRLAGDGNLAQVEDVHMSDIIAVVVRGYRGDKEVCVNSNLHMCAAFIWYRLRFIRRVYNKIKTIREEIK